MNDVGMSDVGTSGAGTGGAGTGGAGTGGAGTGGAATRGVATSGVGTSGVGSSDVGTSDVGLREATGDVRQRREEPLVRVVLLVEPQRDARVATAAVLQAAGYQVLEAADGREAIALLDGGMVPDLIVVDLLVPKIGGWDLWSFLKARPALRDIAVVVWTERHVDAPPERTCAVPKASGAPQLVASVGRVFRAPRRT